MKKIYTLIFSMIVVFANSQDTSETNLLGSMRFRNIGPAGMSGRVTSIDVDLNNENIIYAGSASGGLWKSDNGGQSWNSIFDSEEVLSVGSVKVDPRNSDIIWVGTGEGNPRNSHNSGKGLYKTIDGGKNWELVGLENTRNIHRVLVHPQNSDIVYVCALGVAWGDSEDRGVYKSTDGGDSWEKILYLDESTGAADLVIDPKNPNKIIASMWQFRRNPWFFNSGGPSSGLYITYDGGKSWEKRTSKDGLPKGDLGRIGLAISKSNNKVVYALIENKEKNALYKSDDGGFNWFRVSDDSNIGNRPFYYSDIFVDPTNEDIIYSLWTFLTKSRDGGRTWKTVAPYSTIHPDHHAFWIHPNNPNYIIEGNDGGMNISRDGGSTWRFVENLPLAQFYHISVDNDLPYNVYGGMQDNGSWMGPAYAWSSGGIRNSMWKELYFGDGFDVLPDANDSRYVYAMSQEGNVARIDKETGASTSIKPVHPEGVALRFNWNAPIAQDPFDQNTIYFGSQFVHKSKNKGAHWEIISPDLTTNDPEKQTYTKSGGLTYDVTGAENHTTLLAIAPSPIQEDEIWVSSDDGRLHYTKNAGEEWVDISSNLKGVEEGAWIPFIHVSEYNKGEAFVIVNDYRRNDWKPYLFYTDNYGKSFTNLASDANIPSFCLSVIQDPVAENLLFLGTDVGLYYSLDKGANWEKWGDDLPSVQIADLKIQKREKDLVLGTFGRAAWVLDDIEPLRQLAINKTEIESNALTVFNPPIAYKAAYKEADGTRFAAHAIFSGTNRYSGGRLSYWVNKDENDSISKKQKEVTITIYNSDNEKIRTLKRDVKNGLNRTFWGLREKGVNYPSREPRKEDRREPGGVSVLPGNYKLVISLGEFKDSTYLTVKSDPRIELSNEMLLEQYEFSKLKEGQKLIVDSLMREIHKINGDLKNISGLLDDDKDSISVEIKNRIKVLNDSISSIELVIFGEKDVKGYFDQPETWLSYYYRVGTSSNGSNLGVTQSQRLAYGQLEKKTKEVKEKIDSFILINWKEFKHFVKENPLSLFQE